MLRRLCREFGIAGTLGVERGLTVLRQQLADEDCSVPDILACHDATSV